MSTETKNDKILETIEEELLGLEKLITTKVKSVAGRINCELKESIDLSADATSYRQILIDDRTKYYYKLYKLSPAIKKAKKSKFEFYSMKYPIKTNSTEKNKLIDADMAYYEAKFEFYQTHINFLTESVKTLDHVIYSVKTKVDLYNATGLD